MLTLSGAIVFTLLAYIYVYPIGYFLLNIKRIPEFNSVPFIIKTPAYLTMGFAALAVILGTIGRIILNTTIIFLFFGCFWTLMIILIIKRSYPLVLKQKPSINWRQFIDNIVSFTIFCTIALYFLTAVNQLKWPAPGDAITTGMTVSLILFNKKVPTSYLPLDDRSILYPTGFHAISALLSSFMQNVFYPGEVVVVTAALITTLIPCMLYFLTYMKTRSIIFSFLPFLSIFFVHPSGNRELSILGYFINGTYPNLLGLLLMITFISLIHLWDSSKDSLNLNPIHILFLALILIAAIYFVYLHYLSFVFLYLILFVVSNRKLIMRSIRNSRNTLSIFFGSQYATPMVYSLLSALIFLLLLQLNTIIQLYDTLQYVILVLGEELYGFAIVKSFIYNNINGFMIILVSPIVVMSLLLKKYREFQTNLFYLCIFIPIMLSLNSELYQSFFKFFLPTRSVMLVVSVAWVIFARYLHLISFQQLGFSGFSKKLLHYQSFSTHFVALIIILLIFTQLVPGLKFYKNESLIVPRSLREFWSVSSCERLRDDRIECKHPDDYDYPNDYLAAVWIDKNIPANDMILNDLSWASLYLLSFSVKQVMFSLVGNFREAKDCKVIWDQPDHPELERIMINLFEKYDIQYIWVTAEWGFFDWWIHGGDNLYKTKPKTPAVYGDIFDKYSFLMPVFQIGDSKIYKIMLDDL